ncbi:MAG: SIS domain-containing protein [Candidatus Hodarchaeota archaeon]
MQNNGKNPDFMLSEMLEQPRITYSIFNDINLKNIGTFLLENDIERIYFTGSGDSYCASWFGSNLVSKWCPELYTQYYAPFEFVNYFNPKHLKNSVVIGISVSGNTPRVVEAIRFAQKYKAQTIGITDNPQGMVAQESDFTLYTHTSPPETLETSSYVSEGAREYIGYHHDVAQTKTYLANLAVQSVFLAYLSRKDKSTLNHVQKAFQLVKKAVGQRNYYLNIFDNLNSIVDNVIFVSSGPNGPTGLFGAYKMYEFTLNGFACDIEEYCHTKYFITTEKSLVIFIASDSYSFNRILEIEPVIRNIINAKTIILANSSLLNSKAADYISIETPKEKVLSPLVYTIPIEFFSYSIARNKGFDTNQFRGGQETEKYVSGSYRTIRQSRIHF